jgi:hypothetical protein
MSSAEMVVGALIEIQALLIAWAIYPKVFRHNSSRN